MRRDKNFADLSLRDVIHIHCPCGLDGLLMPITFAAEIERLKQSGQDVSDSTRRLYLLLRALDEMRIQLAQLSPGTVGSAITF
jgi:hypothetical protein